MVRVRVRVCVGCIAFRVRVRVRVSVGCIALWVNSLSHRETPRLGQVRVHKRAYNQVYNEKHWLRVIPMESRGYCGKW